MDSSSGIAVGFIKQGQCYGCSLECFIEFSEQQFWEGTTLCKQLSFDIDMPIIYWYLDVCKLRMTGLSICLNFGENADFWLIHFYLKFMNNIILLYAFRFSHSSKEIVFHNVFWSKVDCQSNTFIFRRILLQSVLDTKMFRVALWTFW